MSAALEITHTSSVTPDQIDHLGHMNVHYYGVNARKGTRVVAQQLGLVGSVTPYLVDTYSRHLAEQLEGARLEVRSGVITATPEHIRVYHELANSDSGAIAAVFVHRLVAPPAEPFADALVAAGAARIAQVPAHGAPRTINLDADPLSAVPSLDTVRQREMAMRRPRVIIAEECLEDGGFDPAQAAQLIWGGETLEGVMSVGPTLVDGPNGEKMGSAAMESRTVVCKLPRVGDTTQSFGGLLHLGPKIWHRANWVFDINSGELLTATEGVSLAFDTVSRKSMLIPDEIRERDMRLHAPEFTPTVG